MLPTGLKDSESRNKDCQHIACKTISSVLLIIPCPCLEGCLSKSASRLKDSPNGNMYFLYVAMRHAKKQADCKTCSWTESLPGSSRVIEALLDIGDISWCRQSFHGQQQVQNDSCEETNGVAAAQHNNAGVPIKGQPSVQGANLKQRYFYIVGLYRLLARLAILQA